MLVDVSIAGLSTDLIDNYSPWSITRGNQRTRIRFGSQKSSCRAQLTSVDLTRRGSEAAKVVAYIDVIISWISKHNAQQRMKAQDIAFRPLSVASHCNRCM